MAAKHGLIVEIGGKKATVMKSDGSFMLVAVRPGARVGELIALPGSSWRRARAFAAVAALIMIIFYTSSVVLPSREAWAYITLDELPGIELAVTGGGRVLSATAANHEGEELLAQLDFSKTNLGDSLEQLLQEAWTRGYLDGESPVVLFSVTPLRSNVSPKVLERLSNLAESAVQKVLSEKGRGATIERVLSSVKQHQEARDAGLSPGQFAVVQKAIEAGAEINVNELTQKNVVQELKAQGLVPSEIISKVQKEQTLKSVQKENREKGGKPDKKTGPPQNPKPVKKISPGRKTQPQKK